MFTSWIKRSALKRPTSKRNLLVSQPSGPSLIMLLSLVGLFLVMGIFVVHQSYAAGTFFNR